MKGEAQVCGRCELPVAGVESLTCRGCGHEYHRLCAGKLGHCAAVGCDVDLLRPPSHPAWPWVRALFWASLVTGLAAFVAWRAPLRGVSAQPTDDPLKRLAGDELALPLEVVRLTHADRRQRLLAAQALERLGPGAAEAEPKLIVRLGREEDDVVRPAVCRALGALGPACSEEGRAALRRALRTDRTTEVRLAAARALGPLEDPSSIPALLAGLELTGAPPAVRAAADGLARLGAAEAVEPLRKLLTHARLRGVAVETLGRIGAPARGTLPDLLALLRSDEAPRPQTLRALGAIAFGPAPAPLAAPEPIVAALRRGLADPAPEVREAAAVGLERAGGVAEPAVPRLLALLLEVEQPLGVRRAVARTLTRLGLGVSGAGVLALRGLLAERAIGFEVRCALALIGRSGAAGRAAIDELVRWGQRQGYGRAAVAALRELGGEPEVARALGRVLTARATEAPAREAALTALRRLGAAAAPALEALQDWARSGPPAQRAGAVAVLAALRSPEAEGALVAALADPAAEVRRAAADALRRAAPLAAPTPARAALLKLETDPDAAVQRAARQAAGELGKWRAR